MTQQTATKPVATQSRPSPVPIPATSPQPLPGSDLYPELDHFYAAHLQHLDDGNADAWAAAFTPDAEFGQNTRPEPRRGREVIAGRMRLAVAGLTERNLVRRHLISNLTVVPGTDGTLRTRYYVLVVDTPRGGESELHLSTVCEDVLVPAESGGWLVSSRYIRHDGLD